MPQRPSTKEEYLKQINIVVEYINNHLDENIDLRMLAEMSNFSPFHFQRIMKAFLGEPIGAFIVRLRVETAAQLIRHTDLPIQEIAYRVGYETPSSLSKVFKQFYNISPSDYRNNKDFTIMKPIQLNANLNISKKKVVTFKPKTAIYIQRIGGYQTLDYGEVWKTLWEYVKENKLFTLMGMEHICIYHNDPKVTSEDKLHTDICLTVSKKAKPKGEIGVKMVKEGKYLMFRYQGSYEHLGSVYDTIYEKHIPEGGYQLRNASCFEKYLNNPMNTAPEKLKTEIYIPIE
ncbi:GyrI-like domain-containing protein [Dysgonomonas sp. 25]|uniref:AraC family transcriptional regulator n=1 Tax=Dysgonomonas sp. 25 TaxID=2302933 RepID=UPI0013D7C853|nr:AraC family transcriptional regulator [Dysgonomonas sp. 25]NDV68412.1 AraC family transcriptional regulator [Dysgonomonas sp. 25]